MTTNRPFSEWGEVFPNAACVVSLIDRLIHHSEILGQEFLGELRAAVWQEYGEDIYKIYDDMATEAQQSIENDLDDDSTFQESL